jgi:hypothetical protein
MSLLAQIWSNAVRVQFQRLFSVRLIDGFCSAFTRNAQNCVEIVAHWIVG